MTNTSKTMQDYGLNSDSNNQSTTVVFFGSGPVAAKSLEFLADHFNIEAVITKPVPPHHKEVAPVEKLANSLGLKTVFVQNKQELDTVINSKPFSSEVGIVVDFGIIITENVINYFKFGIINSHFSLLPQWRGADPITFAILSGQPETGVSLMLIEPSLDTGKLIAQESITINPDETTPTLTDRLIELSNKLLLAYLPIYLKGDVQPIEQQHEQATYSRKLSKSDGIIDWTKSADQIEREIRAFSGWPGSKTSVENNPISVLKAHVTTTQEDKLDILCGDGKYLSIDELLAPSGRKMLAKDFINGYLN